MLSSNRIKGMFLENFLIKLFALLFAIVLWLHASSSGQSEINFVVPLELRNIPTGMAVVGDVPEFVSVRLRGEDRKIRGMTQGDVKVGLDLSGEREGEVGYTITGSDIKIPTGVEVVKISPLSVSFRLDTRVRKQLTVRPLLVGEPADGFKLGKVRTLPDKVGAWGPKSHMEGLTEVATDPVSIQGLKGGLETRVSLQKPRSEYVKMDDSHVIVIVNVDQRGGGG